MPTREVAAHPYTISIVQVASHRIPTSEYTTEFSWRFYEKEDRTIFVAVARRGI